MDVGLEMTFEVELDIARMEPSVKLPAVARACACVVAVAMRPESEQVWDCANCCEISVPTMLKESVSPLFKFAMVCCRVVRLATVAFVFARGTGRLNVQTSMTGGSWPPGRVVAPTVPC